MMQEAGVVQQVDAETDSAKHMVHMLMQFALAVRYRKNVVIIALVITCLLSGLYYATATRYYGAKAGLVLQISGGADPVLGMGTQEGWQRSLLETYVRLIERSEVIEGAIARVPREHRVDFARVSPDDLPQFVQSKLSVSNLDGTNIVEIGYRSKDPNAAVSVVNEVVASYQDFMDRTYRSNATVILEILTKQRDEAKVALTEAENALREARGQTKNPWIDAESRILHPLQQRVVTLNEKHIESQLRLEQLEVQLESIAGAVQRGEDLQQQVLALADIVDQRVLLSRLGLSTDDVALRNTLIQDRIDDLSRLAAMQGHYGWAHPEMQALQARIQGTEQSLLGSQGPLRQQAAKMQDRQMGPMLIEVVQQKLDAARKFEESLKLDLTKAEDRAVRLADQLAWLETLERERDLAQEDLELLVKQIKDIDRRDEGQEVRVHIVDWPKVDHDPVSPSLARTLLIALVSGLGLGFGLVYVLDILDDRFRSMEEMQALLGVPVLAMVRELATSEETGIEALQTYLAPNATESEAFRTLRTALSLAEDDTHQVVISSPEPGDGKTTVLANLAVAVAQSGKRTLLIDADLRRPGLTAMLGMRGIAGLSTVIRGEEDLVKMVESHVRPSGLAGLDVLASGPRPTNPAELLGSQRFSELLAWAESVYDQVFIDSPPTLATSDTAVIGRLTNAVLLVVQPEKNRRRMVTRSVDSFAVHKIPLLGVVVNRVGSGKDGSYYGYGYGGYYGYDYAYRYGGDADEEEPYEPDVAAVAGNRVSNIRMDDQRRLDEASTSGGIVPRRVA